MDRKQHLPLEQRFRERLADEDAKRQQNEHNARKQRLDQITDEVQVPLPRRQPGSRPPSASSRTTSFRSNVKLDTSQPAPPLTPPLSPTQDQARLRPLDTNGGTQSARSEEISNLQAALQDCEAQVNALTVELKSARDKILHLRQERNNAVTDRLHAIEKNHEEEINQCRTKEKHLKEMLQEHQQTITVLEEERDKLETQAGDFRKKLTEAEEAVRDTQEKIEKASRKGVDDGTNGDRNRKRAGRREASGKDWRFSRQKGSKTTPAGALWQLLSAEKSSKPR